MPLEKRLIEPLYICRDNLPQTEDPRWIGKELECMANGSLANVIRQLSCLAFYADDIFSGILNESLRLNKKSEQLQTRINKLSGNVAKLDFQSEEVSFVDDVNCSELFKSSFGYDQEVLSRETMPCSLSRKYQLCDRAPPLDKLNVFRDDGKDAMKFYTNPNFFIDQWRDEMLKKTEKEKFSKKMISNQSLNMTKQIEESHNVKQIKKPRKPENTNEKYRRMMSQQGEFFVDSNSIPDNQRTVNYSTTEYSPYGTIEIPTHSNATIDRRTIDGQNSFLNSQTKSTQPFRLNDFNQTSIAQKENTNHVRFNQTPEIIPYPNSPINMKGVDQVDTTLPQQNIPIPPPMPDSVLASNNNSINISNNLPKNSSGIAKTSISQQATSLAQEILAKQQQLRTAPIVSKPIAQVDARSTLLASIREGIKLRSVQARKQKQVEKNASLKNDVASILQRRVALQLSDSDSNNSNESDDDWADN